MLTLEPLKEGDNLTLKCSVNKQNMSANWYKDGKPLTEDGRIRKISKDVRHVLQIQNVCPEDSGEYSVKIEGLTSTTKIHVKGMFSIFICFF